VIFSTFWRRIFGYQEFKVCIVGLDNAGKTTILFQLHLGEVVETQPTIGSNVEEVIHKNVHFQVWDLSGQDTLRSSWSAYYTNTQAMILVIDCSDRKRIDLVKTELAKILANEELQDAVLLIFANKQDVKDCLTLPEIAESLNLHAIKNHPWHLQACCALTGDGLYEGIDWITKQITGQYSFSFLSSSSSSSSSSFSSTNTSPSTSFASSSSSSSSQDLMETTSLLSTDIGTDFLPDHRYYPKIEINS